MIEVEVKLEEGDNKPAIDNWMLINIIKEQNRDKLNFPY